MLEILNEYIKEAIGYIRKHKFIRIFSHYDTDGIASAVIMVRALLRKNIPFHLSFLKRLDREVVGTIDADEGDLVVFLDMGSGHGEVLKEIEGDVLVIDHHYPRDNPKCVHVNPYLGGIDGAIELSSAGTTYLLARMMGDNLDLSSFAIIGALGDKQKMSGVNKIILDEAESTGYVRKGEGIPLYSMKVKEALELSTEPYLGFYGNEEELDAFLSRIGVDGEKSVDELDTDERRRLSNGIVLRILKRNSFEGVVDELMTRNFVLPGEVIQNATMLADVINSCGRMGLYGVAVGLSLGDRKYCKKGIDVFRSFQIKLLEKIRECEDKVVEGQNIRYLILNNSYTTGPLATVLSRYMFSDRPFLVVNVKKNIVKSSVRGNLKLVEKGLDLGLVMKEAGESVGGTGGGHNVAAAATFEPGRELEFVKKVDELCGKMMN